MKHFTSNATSILIIETDPVKREMIQRTLAESEASIAIASSTTDAVAIAESSSSLRLIICRMHGVNIDGLELTRYLRAQPRDNKLTILIVVPEELLNQAGEAIEAGADDVLIEPFEARELRMLTDFFPSRRHRRIDAAHAANNGCPEPAKDSLNAAHSPATTSFVRPFFDTQSMRYTFQASPDQIEAWLTDERVTQVTLDRIMTCPECNAAPTFRFGCSHCGSAMVTQDNLIHHYACGHVGPESQFVHGHSDISCPKCRHSGLVAGSDFELTAGVFRCSDCSRTVNALSLIGHCVCCNHRFDAKTATIVDVQGFYVHGIRPIHLRTDSSPETRQNCESGKAQTTSPRRVTV
ncbi:MAG: response regulator [Planctomycetaceae bacterium]|nr:response regulator [Planctomycetaceae bacterium]